MLDSLFELFERDDRKNHRNDSPRKRSLLERLTGSERDRDDDNRRSHFDDQHVHSTANDSQSRRRNQSDPFDLD